MRKRIILSVSSVLAVLGISLAFALPASASFSGTMVAANGDTFLNSANFNYGTSMISSTTASRTVCTPGRATDPLDTIRLCGSNAPADRCVIGGTDGSYNLFIGHCNAVASLWNQIVSPDGQTVYFKNNHYTDRYIAFDNVNGDVAVARPLGANGWYYKMYGIPPIP